MFSCLQIFLLNYSVFLCTSVNSPLTTTVTGNSLFIFIFIFIFSKANNINNYQKKYFRSVEGSGDDIGGVCTISGAGVAVQSGRDQHRLLGEYMLFVREVYAADAHTEDTGGGQGGR